MCIKAGTESLKKRIYFNVNSEEVTPGHRVAKTKPYLRLVNKNKRLRRAKEHRHWTEEDWKKVLWADKSKLRFEDHKEEYS